jgi:hypothetical protein
MRSTRPSRGESSFTTTFWARSSPMVGQERGPAFAAEARVDGPKLDQVTGLKHESSSR